MKNSTRWLVLVRELATALGLSRAAALWATKIPCVMRNPQGLGNRLPQPIADMGELHDPIKYRQRLGGMLSSLNRSSAVRKDSTKLTANLHQGAFETYTKRMSG